MSDETERWHDGDIDMSRDYAPTPDRFTRETVTHTQTDHPHAYTGPLSVSREDVTRFLIDHGVWQQLGTSRASQLAAAVTDLIEAARP